MVRTVAEWKLKGTIAFIWILLVKFSALVFSKGGWGVKNIGLAMRPCVTTWATPPENLRLRASNGFTATNRKIVGAKKPLAIGRGLTASRRCFSGTTSFEASGLYHNKFSRANTVVGSIPKLGALTSTTQVTLLQTPPMELPTLHPSKTALSKTWRI